MQAADELSADALAISAARVIAQLVDELKLQITLRDIAQDGLRNALRERDVLREELERLRS